MGKVPVDHKREIYGVFYLATALILALAYYLPNRAGQLGELLRDAGFGLLGVVAWALPVLFVYMCLDYFLESHLRVTWMRFTYVLLLMMTTSTLLHLFTVNPAAFEALSIDSQGRLSAGMALRTLWRSGIDPALISQHGPALTGGLLGGILALALMTVAARTGALIVDMALILSLIVLLFNVSYSHAINRTARVIQRTGSRVDQAVRTSWSRRQKQRQPRSRRTAAQRLPDPATGIGQAEALSPAPLADAPRTRPLDASQFDIPLQGSAAEERAAAAGPGSEQSVPGQAASPDGRYRSSLVEGWRNFWRGHKDNGAETAGSRRDRSTNGGPVQNGDVSDIPAFLQPSPVENGGFFTIGPAAGASGQPAAAASPLEYGTISYGGYQDRNAPDGYRPENRNDRERGYPEQGYAENRSYQEKNVQEGREKGSLPNDASRPSQQPAAADSAAVSTGPEYARRLVTPDTSRFQPVPPVPPVPPDAAGHAKDRPVGPITATADLAAPLAHDPDMAADGAAAPVTAIASAAVTSGAAPDVAAMDVLNGCSGLANDRAGGETDQVRPETVGSTGPTEHTSGTAGTPGSAVSAAGAPDSAIGAADCAKAATDVADMGNDDNNPAQDHFGRGQWTDRGDAAPADFNGPRKIGPIPSEPQSRTPAFMAPPITLLREDNQQQSSRNQGMIQALGSKLETTLASFGIEAHVVNFTTGPTITRFELTPGPGVKVSRIVNLADDIALNLAAMGVRIEAPIPGKSAIGIEIPNKETVPVLLRGLLESSDFLNAASPLTAAIGRDIQGNPILCDLARMPHLLIAGSTGSGKSVCINSILISILYKANPEKVKLLMIDPKVVELNVYNGIPHLLQPVVTDPKKAASLLLWAVNEMLRRYTLFAQKAVRDISSYNASLGLGLDDEEEEQLPLILLVIDELSDLMATTPTEVEDAIARLTAMARAAGIHLIIATQRPSVDVITGVIKANIPSRVAFAVASQVDSRTILDMAGAEKLLGKGDMLYYPQSAAKPIRGQGAFVTDAEVESVINYFKQRYAANYDQAIADAIHTPSGNGKKEDDNDQDELLPQALRICVETGYASVSLLQRRMTVGYPRAARLIDRMHELGYIGGFEGSKPRKVLVTLPQLMEMQMKDSLGTRDDVM